MKKYVRASKDVSTNHKIIIGMSTSDDEGGDIQIVAGTVVRQSTILITGLYGSP